MCWPWNWLSNCKVYELTSITSVSILRSRSDMRNLWQQCPVLQFDLHTFGHRSEHTIVLVVQSETNTNWRPSIDQMDTTLPATAKMLCIDFPSSFSVWKPAHIRHSSDRSVRNHTCITVCTVVRCHHVFSEAKFRLKNNNLKLAKCTPQSSDQLA